MADYYIRTPDYENSRGPFDAAQLLSLAEAGQITENTLHYDENKEEWVPIALNEKLNALVFPEREPLSLRSVEKKEARAPCDTPKKEGLKVHDMLAAASCETDETSHIKKQNVNFEKAASLSPNGIAIAMLLSALALLTPYSQIISDAISAGQVATIINYPIVLIGLFDFVMAALLLLAMTEVYPLLRARAMLTLGFGLYLGWSLEDPLIALTSVMAGIGIFYATISRSYGLMITVLALAIGGNAILSYLAFIDRFSGVFEKIYFQIISA